MPLDTKPRQVLNEYFVKNAIPTETQFKELIDASINQADDGVFRTGMSEPLSVVAANDGKKHALRLYATYPAQQPEWLINLAPANGVSGLSISDGAGNSRLFIDKTRGRVGIGTVTPSDALTVQNGDVSIQGGHYRRLEIVSDTSHAGLELVARELGKDVDPNKAGNPHIDFTHGDLDAPNYGVRVSATNNQTLQIESDLSTKNVALAVRGTLWTDKAIGVGTSAPTGMLDVRVAGTGGWDRFVVNTTNQWGNDGVQHVTIGAGGANGLMINNPHVPWSNDRASIRYGRSGGVVAGHYWDVGVRADNAFSFAQNASAHRLWINGDGKVGINTTTPNHFLTVQNGDVSIQGGRYRRLKVISDQYWAGIELIAREQGEAGHPHIDFTHGEFDNPNYGIRVVGVTNQRLDIEAQTNSAELRVHGEILARAFKTTIYRSDTNHPVGLSNSNNWLDFPTLSLAFNLPAESTILINFHVAMQGDGSHLVLRLLVDGVVQSRTICRGEFWFGSHFWPMTLAAGSHTVTVQYRTPKGGVNNPDGNDWHDRSLTVVVLGAAT